MFIKSISNVINNFNFSGSKYLAFSTSLYLMSFSINTKILGNFVFPNEMSKAI